VASILCSVSAGAQSIGVPDSAVSYWGTIPDASSGVAVPISDRPKAIWEKALIAPYRVVTFPIATVSHGVGSGIEYLDDHSVLDRVGRLLGPRQGPFGLLLDFRLGGLSGLGGGLTAEHANFFGEQNTLRVRASTSTNHDQRLGLAARFRGPRGAYSEVGAGYRQRPNVRYFGIGPDTREEDESFLHQEAAWAGATIRRPLGGASHLDATLEYTTVATGAPGSSHDPPTEDAFAASLPAGYGRHSFGVAVGGEWMHETPGLANRPGRGGIQRLRTMYFKSTDRDDVRYWAFRGETQQFVTLWRPRRVLALRGVASWIEDVGIDPVPAARLNTNDDPDLFRGYDDFRFRDRGLALLTAEYRWPVWAHEHSLGSGIDAYLLSDAGQVFGDADQLGWRRLTFSYGGGLRVESGHGFVFRIEYARSDEASVLRFRADQVFQFTKRGFLYGREPIPVR
jgi:outer membrane protein assembly factor BamA